MIVSRLLWKIANKIGLPEFGRRIASNWPFPVRVTLQGGRQMYVDLRSTIGRGLFVSGEFDLEAIRPALEALRPGSTFIDVGANVGVYSIMALDHVGPHGNIYSFEIDLRPLRCLRKSVAVFEYCNICITQAAISDSDGTLSFVPMAEHGHNKINRNAGAGTTVKSLRLDTWAQQIRPSRVDVIKIDVEGAEKFVLEGARDTIARFKPLLLCECDEKTAAAFGYTPTELVRQIEDMGYEVSWLVGVYTPTILARPH